MHKCSFVLSNVPAICISWLFELCSITCPALRPYGTRISCTTKKKWFFISNSPIQTLIKALPLAYRLEFSTATLHYPKLWPNRPASRQSFVCRSASSSYTSISTITPRPMPPRLLPHPRPRRVASRHPQGDWVAPRLLPTNKSRDNAVILPYWVRARPPSKGISFWNH